LRYTTPAANRIIGNVVPATNSAKRARSERFKDKFAAPSTPEGRHDPPVSIIGNVAFSGDYGRRPNHHAMHLVRRRHSTSPYPRLQVGIPADLHA
jgi:hypothetical protein